MEKLLEKVNNNVLIKLKNRKYKNNYDTKLHST